MTTIEKKKLVYYLQNTPAELVAEQIDADTLSSAVDSFIETYSQKLLAEKSSLESLIGTIDEKLLEVQ